MKYSIEDLPVKDKKIFMRVDFNVPLDKNLKITDTTRIDKSLPSIQKLLQMRAKLCLASHLGRPNGIEEKYSLKPVAAYLSQKLGIPVHFCPTVLGPVANLAVSNLKAGECLLFENIRFFPEEEKNDAAFSAEVAQLFDFYANDAFGTAHRAHASTYGIAQHFATPAAGYLMLKEILFLSKALQTPDHPYVAILGGAKVKDKIKVIEQLLDKADSLLIGGGMAYSFLKYQGQEIGDSLFDAESPKSVEAVLITAAKRKKKILLPIDHVVAQKFDSTTGKIVERIESGWMGLDIGPKTIKLYEAELKPAKFVLWNGPMGVFENPAFQRGTFAIAQALGASQATTLVGGGDSVAAITQAKVADKITHVSTGGGASLEFLEGRVLPGIAVLKDKP